jgi:type IV secretory pathway TraG/TraD family ATPase VirD4
MALQAIQDIDAGKGVCVVDPHGGLIEDILPYIPKERLEDVIIFDPSDGDRPIGLNMLEASTSYEMDMAAQEMIQIFYKLLPDPAMAGPMFEHYMRNALLALMSDQDDPGTLVELARIFTDETYRRKKLEHVKDILVRDFWEREYTASQKGSTGADMLSYVISKTGRFVENEIMRNVIGQSRSGINFREVMDKGKILLMNLSKGKIGETNSNLLGLIAVSKLQMAALARADMPEEQRKDFYLYIDEFQNFITDSISIILSEARKYKLNLIMGHQFIAQLVQNNDTRVRDAIFGNVGTVAAYRIGVDDAETIAKQLGPKASQYDVMNVEKYNTYLRLLIDNQASDAFNVAVYNFKDVFPGNPSVVSPLKELSRLKYGRDKNIVVREIIERSKIGQLGLPKKSPLEDLL